MVFVKRVFVFFGLALTLVGCSSIKVTPEQRTAIAKIGVYSYLSDTMHHINIGTLVFANKYEERQVPEWNIRTHSEQAALEEISKSSLLGGATAAIVKDDAVRPEEVDAVYDDHDRIVALARAQNFDTLVVIRPVRYSNSPYMEPGYGVFNKSMFGSDNPCGYALFSIAVVSVNTDERIGWGWGFETEAGMFSSRPVFMGPCAKNGVFWRETLSEYSAAELASVGDVVRNQVAFGVHHALDAAEMLRITPRRAPILSK